MSTFPLSNLINRYKFSSEKISYYLTYLNSCIFSIKTRRKRAKKNKHVLKINKPVDGFAILCPLFVEFLDYQSTFNLLLVNTVCYKMKKRICKKVLKHKEVSMKTRLAIWRVMLDVESTKYDYEKAKLESDKIEASVAEIIHLDVIRTFFETDIVEKRLKVETVLRALAHKNHKVNYCQGMNYIVAFLFQLIDDEEETFHLMDALFNNTEFSQIFLDDLKRLKKFFLVFDRLGQLMLPELFSSLRLNSISVNFFCSPWFLTLCTSYCTFKDGPPTVVIKIWDEFIMKGWKAVFKTGILLLKKYEYRTMELKYEELLNFLLNNDKMKKEFFHNSNYDDFIKQYRNTRIESGLLRNIENECELAVKHQESEKIQNNI